MDIPWDMLFEFLLKAIELCKENNETDEQIAERLRNPRGLALYRLGWKVRDEWNMSRREWRQVSKDVLQQIRDEAAQLSDEDIANLIADATCCDDA